MQYVDAVSRLAAINEFPAQTDARGVSRDVRTMSPEEREDVVRASEQVLASIDEMLAAHQRASALLMPGVLSQADWQVNEGKVVAEFKSGAEMPEADAAEFDRHMTQAEEALRAITEAASTVTRTV